MNVGPRRSQPGQRREPRKIITVCVKEDVHLKKAENAWKPSLKRENQTEDPENVKTQVRAKAGLRVQQLHQVMVICLSSCVRQ